MRNKSQLALRGRWREIAESYKRTKSLIKTAEEFGCSYMTVSRILDRHGIARDGKPGPAVTKYPRRQLIPYAGKTRRSSGVDNETEK